MSEENRKQGHNGTGGNGGLFGRLFSKKTDQPAGNGDAGKSLNEMIDEENRDTYPEDAASGSRQDADGEEFVFSGLEGSLTTPQTLFPMRTIPIFSRRYWEA